jgi:hypothetical protein
MYCLDFLLLDSGGDIHHLIILIISLNTLELRGGLGSAFGNATGLDSFCTFISKSPSNSK